MDLKNYRLRKTFLILFTPVLLSVGLAQAQTIIDVTFPSGTGTNPSFSRLDNGRGGGGTWD